MKQGEAVFQAVSAVLPSIDGAVTLTGEQLSRVYSMVLDFFKSGQVVHSKTSNEVELRKYIPGLVNNWLRKDPRLNGGIKYTPKHPGRRTGSKDESVRAMRTLLSTIKDPTERATIEACITARLNELKPKPTINVEALPKELLSLVK